MVPPADIPDHLLIVLEAAAGQHHPLASFHVDRPVSSLGPHAQNFLRDIMLNQRAPRVHIELKSAVV